MKLMKDLFGLDGVDLDVEDGAADAEIQLEVLNRLRNACGEDFHIRQELFFTLVAFGW